MLVYQRNISLNIHPFVNNNVKISKDRFYGNVRLGYDFGKGFSGTLQAGTDVDNETTKRWGAIVEWVPGSPQDNASAQETVGAVEEIKRTITHLAYKP